MLLILLIETMLSKLVKGAHKINIFPQRIIKIPVGELYKDMLQ